MATRRGSTRAWSGAAGGWEWPDAWAQVVAAREEDLSGDGEPSIYMQTQCGGSTSAAAVVVRATGCREAEQHRRRAGTTARETRLAHESRAAQTRMSANAVH
jgi:hypothetical protein